MAADESLVGTSAQLDKAIHQGLGAASAELSAARQRPLRLHATADSTSPDHSLRVGNPADRIAIDTTTAHRLTHMYEGNEQPLPSAEFQDQLHRNSTALLRRTASLADAVVPARVPHDDARPAWRRCGFWPAQIGPVKGSSPPMRGHPTAPGATLATVVTAAASAVTAARKRPASLGLTTFTLLTVP